MPKADHVLGLIRAYGHQDDEKFGQHVAALVADEKARNHNRVAQQYASAWERRPGSRQMNRMSQNALETSFPQQGMDRLVLADLVRGQVRSVIQEHRQAVRLRQHNIEPRHKILLVGPPGNGKTSLARAIAHELDLPLYTVRYEQVVSDLLGKSSKMLTDAFRSVGGPGVVFLDEMDSIACDRGEANEHYELKRLLNNLLVNIDEMDPRVILVGATNIPERLDRAIWRRFQLTIEMPIPDHAGISALLELLRGNHGFEVDDTDAVVDALHGWSFSQAEDRVVDLVRQAIIDGSEPVVCASMLMEQLGAPTFVPSGLNGLAV